LDLIGLAGC